MPREIVGPAAAAATRRAWLKGVAGAAAAGLMAGGGWFVARRGRNLFEVRREHALMQTTVVITCLDPDAERAARGIDAAFRHMGAVVAVLTRFDPGAPVGRLNRTGRLDDPPLELREVVRRSLAISALTDGDFDITVLPALSFLESLQRPAVLTSADRAAIRGRDRLIDYRHVALDQRALRLTRPGMGVTLDGLAKGYVIDQGMEALRASGMESALIDAGGDLRGMTRPGSERQWHVGIVDPFDLDRIAAVVPLRNAALGTSGNYRIFFSADRTLFHVIDPHTGFSPLNYSSITVMADNSTDADAMSVAAASMPLPRLREVMAAQNHQWLVFARDSSASWRSSALPLLSGSAKVA